jgi:hypothetical protein
LPDSVEIWIGGPGAEALELPDGVTRTEIEDLEHRLGLLAERASDA